MRRRGQRRCSRLFSSSRRTQLLPPLFALHSHFVRMEWNLWNRQREREKGERGLHYMVVAHRRRPLPQPLSQSGGSNFSHFLLYWIGQMLRRPSAAAAGGGGLPPSLPPKIYQLFILFPPPLLISYELPDMMSASEGGAGSGKSRCSKGGLVNSIV